jgi:hypothetical protein
MANGSEEEPRVIGWRAHCGTVAVNTQIDLIPDGLEDEDDIPNPRAGDRVVVEYPNNERERGQIIDFNNDATTIKIGDDQWVMTQAKAEDNPAPQGEGMRSVQWIVRSKVAPEG